MSSAAVLVSAIGIVALAASLANPQGEPATLSGAAHGQSFIVAQDGSGDFDTITAAVAAAADGDTVLVRPGRYNEAFTIDTSITLAGDGPREAVIIEGVPQPWIDEAGEPILDENTGEPGFSVEAITIVDTDATVRDLTIVGHDDGDGPVLNQGIVIHGGAPTVERVAVVNRPNSDGENSVGVDGGAALVIDSDLDGDVWLNGGSPTITGNVVGGDVWIFCPSGSDGPSEDECTAGVQPVVRGNTLTGLSTYEGASPLITENLVQGPRFLQYGATVYDNAGIVITGTVRDTGTAPVVTGNTVTGQAVGISVNGETSATIEDNVVSDNGTGMTISGSSGSIRGNVISGSDVGVTIEAGADPMIEGNRLESNDLGVSVGRYATPVILGNVFCGNGNDIKALVGEAPSLDGNEVCVAVASS